MIISSIWFKKNDEITDINLFTKKIITTTMDDANVFKTEIKINPYYIENFYSDNILSILGVVGKNASGKTTLFGDFINIMNGTFKNKFIIYYENISGELCYHTNIESTHFFVGTRLTNRHYPESTSTFLMTNMLDNNPLFLEGYKDNNFINNITKTYLVSKTKNLEDFFLDEMHSNIRFVAVHKDNTNIEKYIKLPRTVNTTISIFRNDLNKSEDEDDVLAFDDYDDNIDVLINSSIFNTLKYEIYGSDINEKLEYIMVNLLVALDEKYVEIKNNYKYINYDFLETYFGEVIYSYRTPVLKMVEKFGDALLSISNFDITNDNDTLNYLINRTRENEDKEGLEVIKNDEAIKRDLFSNTFYEDFSLSKTEIDIGMVNDFLELISEYEVLIELSKTFFEDDQAVEVLEDLEQAPFLKLYKDLDIKEVAKIDNDFFEILKKWKDYVKINYSWRNLSSGENSFLTLFSRLYEKKDLLKQDNIIFIDEGDMTFHPEWQKKWMHIITNILSIVFNDHNFQLVLSTHSPFILSDISSNDIILLEDRKKTKAEGLTLTFGSNIQDLLTNAFFIKEGMVGEFAKEKINNLIDRLLSNKETALLREEHNDISLIKDLIAEPIVRRKVNDIYNEKMSNIQTINSRMIKLENELKGLREIMRLEDND